LFSALIFSNTDCNSINLFFEIFSLIKLSFEARVPGRGLNMNEYEFINPISLINFKVSLKSSLSLQDTYYKI